MDESTRIRLTGIQASLAARAAAARREAALGTVTAAARRHAALGTTTAMTAATPLTRIPTTTPTTQTKAVAGGSDGGRIE